MTPIYVHIIEPSKNGLIFSKRPDLARGAILEIDSWSFLSMLVPSTQKKQ
jgi:hypothetical protein